MQAHTDFRLRSARERQAELIRDAENARLLAGRPRRATPRSPIRRAIGTRIIAIGTRLAADRSLEPARSR